MNIDKSSEYRFVTTWKIESPIADVWSVLVDFQTWTSWWKGLKDMSKIGGNGESVYKLTVGYLIYFLTFQFYIDKIVFPYSVYLHATGDLEGKGEYELSEVNNVTTVIFTWNVSVTKPWVKFASKFAHPFFEYCHNLVMNWFAKGMARQLHSRLLEITY